jgi:hypothetical protein
MLSTDFPTLLLMSMVGQVAIVSIIFAINKPRVDNQFVSFLSDVVESVMTQMYDDDDDMSCTSDDEQEEDGSNFNSKSLKSNSKSLKSGSRPNLEVQSLNAMMRWLKHVYGQPTKNLNNTVNVNQTDRHWQIVWMFCGASIVALLFLSLLVGTLRGAGLSTLLRTFASLLPVFVITGVIQYALLRTVILQVRPVCAAEVLKRMKHVLATSCLVQSMASCPPPA